MTKQTKPATGPDQTNLHPAVALHYEDFTEREGYGPCGAVAAVLRERGMGQVMLTAVDPHDGSSPFLHFVIQTDQGEIIDWTNPFSGSTYGDPDMPDEPVFVALEDDELPDLVDDVALDYWRERLPEAA
jgi:hypothetical protein